MKFYSFLSFVQYFLFILFYYLLEILINYSSVNQEFCWKLLKSFSFITNLFTNFPHKVYRFNVNFIHFLGLMLCIFKLFYQMLNSFDFPICLSWFLSDLIYSILNFIHYLWLYLNLIITSNIFNLTYTFIFYSHNFLLNLSVVFKFLIEIYNSILWFVNTNNNFLNLLALYKRTKVFF